jgi:hypothetical protein
MVGRAASSVTTAIRGMLPFFGVAMIGMYANRAIELASSLTEVQNVVDVTFGQGAAQINAWARTAISSFGLSELQAKQFTSSLGAMMKSSGVSSDRLYEMSTRLSGLAGDFASFYNLPIEEAFDKIRSGISGETEPLKRLGINMSVANLQAFALTQGIRKQWERMSQAEQVQLRYAYLMRVSADAQGDFSRTLSTSYANQKRVMGVQFDQFLARMAIGILPALTNLFKMMNDAISKIDTEKFSNGLKIVVDLLPYLVGGFVAYKFALIAAAAWQAAIVGIGWVTYLASMLPIMRASIKAQGLYNFLLKGTAFYNGIAAASQWLLNAAFLGCPVVWIILGIMALIAVGVLLYRNWDVVKEKFIGAMNIMWEGIKSFGRGFMTYMLLPVNLLISGIIKLLEIAALIPGVGGKFATAAASVRDFQANMNAATGATNYLAPNAGEAQRNAEGQAVNVNIQNRNVETTAAVTPRRSATVTGNMGANP